MRRIDLRPRFVALPTAAALFFGSLTAGPARALDPGRAITQYAHRVWSSDNGLPQSSVKSIIQTRDGYLWIGTQEGVARFDGVRFTVFDRFNTAAIRHPYIDKIFEDQHGVIWIGTNGGGITRFADGRFTSFGPAEGLSNAFVTAIAEDRDGTLWVGTDGGVHTFRKGRFERFRPSTAISDDHILALHSDGEGGMWIGTAHGLNRWDGWKVTGYTTGDGLLSEVILALHRDRQGNLWVGTTGGLHRFAEGRFIPYRQGPGTSHESATAILEDRDGNLWVGRDGGGLQRFRNGKFESYTSREGLSQDIVWTLCEDREGNLWIGTDSGGMDQLRDGNVTPFTRTEGLSSDSTWAVYEDRAGALWVGTYGGGLDRLKNGEVRTYTRRDGLGDDDVWAIVEDRSSDIWVGTDTGISRIHEGQIRSYGAADGLPAEAVRALYEDRTGALWIGTDGAGVVRWVDGKPTAVYTTKEGLSHDAIRAIAGDRRGVVWVGTYGGGLSYLRDGTWHALTTRQGLASDVVYSLYEDPDGALWIGTSGGGLQCLRDGRLTTYTRKHGLFDDVILTIVDDGLGNLWMSCNRGIFSVKKAELADLARGAISSVSSVSLGRADGMPSPECNAGHPAGARRRDGTLWFPTIKGLISIDPTRLRRNERLPPVSIEQVTADATTVDLRKRAKLPARTRRLEFRFTAPSLVVPERVRFRYRLDGFDREWTEVADRRVAAYTNVPPGPYRFQVTACNDAGLWNPHPVSYEFSVTPTFYQTTWFPALCVGGVGLAVGGGYLRRVRKARQREAELTRLVRDRTQLLEEANVRLEELSARDPLTGIANRRRFDEILELEWRRAVRTHSTLSIIMIDIDSFKEFNDRYGHAAGDDCLRRVAAALDDTLHRAGDLVARYGGEEFSAILPSSEAEATAAVAHRLRRAVEALGITHGGSGVAPVVTVSLGVASAVPTENIPAPLFVAAADRALYRAKREGRNRVRSADRAGAEPAA